MKHISSSLLTACVLAFVACAKSTEPAPLPLEAQDSPVAAPQPPVDKLDGPMPEQLTLEYRACTTDADCVLALNGCCDCANGGQDVAVSRERLGDFKARFQCTGACTERGGDCGNGTITCTNKLCTYGEAP